MKEFSVSLAGHEFGRQFFSLAFLIMTTQDLVGLHVYARYLFPAVGALSRALLIWEKLGSY